MLTGGCPELLPNPVKARRVLGVVLCVGDSHKLFLNYLWSGCLRPCAELSIGGGLCAACVSSQDMSDWIQCWQMAEKQRYGVNVSLSPTPACSAAEPQKAGWGVNKQDDSFASHAASKQNAITFCQ